MSLSRSPPFLIGHDGTRRYNGAARATLTATKAQDTRFTYLADKKNNWDVNTERKLY